MNDAIDHIVELIKQLQPYQRIEIKMTDRRKIVVERKTNEREEF